MIAVIDYGSGNLRSVVKALESVGAEAIVTQNAKEITNANKIVLPGVGAMEQAMQRLKDLNLTSAIQETIKGNKPFLGICLGLQLLFSESEEGGKVKGLEVIPGKVKKLKGQKVPHIGWNQVKIVSKENPLFKGIPDESSFYFCHSYYVTPEEVSIVAAKTDYGINFTSAIWKNKLFGVQFHPEKSQALGLRLLENFVKL